MDLIKTQEVKSAGTSENKLFCRLFVTDSIYPTG